MKTEEKTPMITKSRLKSERGWTDKLLKTFLPAPDLTKPNLHYKSGPPMLLFAIEKIDAIEQTEEFKKAVAETAKRKEGAKKAVETKLGQLRNWLNAVQVDISDFDRDKLIERACKHYNEMQKDRMDEWQDVYGKEATADSDPKFLERICVNYLRHRLTRYEQLLDEMSGKVGFAEGYKEIRRKIFAKISERHEWLADECKRQQGDERYGSYMGKFEPRTSQS